MADRLKHILLIYFHSISKVIIMVCKYCVIFILSVTFHANRTQQYCHQAFAEDLNLLLVSSLLFYFWVFPWWRVCSFKCFYLFYFFGKSFILTSWWDLCTSSTDRAPPHGEEDEEEEKKTVGSQARNLRVAPPLQGKPSRPVTRHNGDLESVFDDSTLSELSEEDRRYTCSIYVLFNVMYYLQLNFICCIVAAVIL